MEVTWNRLTREKNRIMASGNDYRIYCVEKTSSIVSKLAKCITLVNI